MARGQFSKKDYLNCSRGKWRMKVNEGHPEAQIRVEENDAGQKVTMHEIVYDFVSGVVKKIWTETHEKFGSKWCIQIHDDDDVMVLNVGMNSGYASAMITKMLNANIARPIKFVPYYFEEEKKARMVLYQDDQKVESLYTRENPGDFPPFPSTGDKDDIALWKIHTNKFLKQKVKDVIMPNLPKEEDVSSEESLNSIPSASSPGPTGVEKKSPPSDDVPFPEEPDDLPF